MRRFANALQPMPATQAHGAGFLLAAEQAVDIGARIMRVADFKVGVGSGEENRVHMAVLDRLAHESLRVRMLGSAALDLAWLACGRLNATLMLSNLPWDVTAGLLLVREAGGFVYDHDGSPHGPGSRFTIASVPSLVKSMVTIFAEAM